VIDDSEELRRLWIDTGVPQADLATTSQRWDHIEVARDFEIVAFAAPFCVAIRKSDGARGSLEFVHSPRFYFNFVPDKP
jgi:hypothetical protein